MGFENSCSRLKQWSTETRLTFESKLFLEDAATKFREDLELYDYVFDVVKFVNNIGGTIEYSNADLLFNYPIKTGDETFTIITHNNYSIEQQRVDIMQKIGHLFMHMKFGTITWQKLNKGDTYIPKTGTYTLCHDEVTYFATALLIPREHFGEIVFKMSENNKFDYKRIADYFKVTHDAVIYRGKELGYTK